MHLDVLTCLINMLIEITEYTEHVTKVAPHLVAQPLIM